MHEKNGIQIDRKRERQRERREERERERERERETQTDRHTDGEIMGKRKNQEDKKEITTMFERHTTQYNW